MPYWNDPSMYAGDVVLSIVGLLTLCILALAAGEVVLFRRDRYR